MTSPLIIGVPSKGRLQDNTRAIFSDAGMKISRPGGDRNYRGVLKGIDNVQINFLSASEIAGQIADGSIHIGVTGEDLIREEIADISGKAHLVQKLGFGHADVVIAVPSGWIDVRNMSDLNEVSRHFVQKKGQFLRVATKYIELTRQFFDQHNITDYRIVKSLGATEGAPAADQAECIVDITSTGSTLKANNLRVIEDGVILKSEANLVASLKANWSIENLETLKMVLGRITARQNAKEYTIVNCYPNADLTLEKMKMIISAQAILFNADIIGHDGLSLKVKHKNAVALAEALTETGITYVTLTHPQMIMSSDVPIFDELVGKIA